MRKLLIIFTLFNLTSTSLLGQKKPTRINGTVKIGENISMKATEVTIREWMCFIANNNYDSTLFPKHQSISFTTQKVFEDLKKRDKAIYLKILTYSRVMQNDYGKYSVIPTSKFKELQDLDTNDFSLNVPIAGITFEQANKYCKWREELVNNSQKVQVEITLPTVEMYKTLINNIDSLCRKKCDDCEKFYLNCLTAICNSHDKPKLTKSQGRSVLRADAYNPTNLGLYNLQGNVAEMTLTKGVAMGGSFRHFARQSFNDQIQEYFNPTDWLGFRFIVKLK